MIEALQNGMALKWVRIAATVVVAGGGLGGWASALTIPDRLDTLETRTTNESTYLRGEIVALQIQVGYAICLAEGDSLPDLNMGERSSRGRLCDRIRRASTEATEQLLQSIGR